MKSKKGVPLHYSSLQIIDLLQMNINLFKLKLDYKDCSYSDEVSNRDSVGMLAFIYESEITNDKILSNIKTTITI